MTQHIYPINIMVTDEPRNAGAITAWDKWCTNMHPESSRYCESPQYCEFLSIFLSHGNATEEFRCHMFHEELGNSHGVPRRCKRCLSLDQKND